jgi:hypothetical protein
MIATLWHVGGQTAFREGIRLNSASGICGTCRSRPGDVVGTPAKQPSEGVARASRTASLPAGSRYGTVHLP